MSAGILAHGGTAGAAGELAFVLIPVGVFALLSRASRKRREQEDAAGTEAEAEAGSDPEASAP